MHDDFYQVYLEELKGIAPCAAEERDRLLSALKAGDKSARTRLIEGHLYKALEYARGYADRGVFMSDLVQEANMALTAAVNGWRGEEFDACVKERICEALELAVREQAEAARAGEELAARANVLSRVARELADELGREATAGELAERMKMTEEEIRQIMKITIDALSV